MRAPAPPSGRWAIAWAGSAVMLLIGTIYSWGIFTQPLLVAFQWDLTTTTWTYAIANFSLAAVGTLVGGFWQDRVGPRRVAMLGIGRRTRHDAAIACVYTPPPLHARRYAAEASSRSAMPGTTFAPESSHLSAPCAVATLAYYSLNEKPAYGRSPS